MNPHRATIRLKSKAIRKESLDNPPNFTLRHSNGNDPQLPWNLTPEQYEAVLHPQETVNAILTELFSKHKEN